MSSTTTPRHDVFDSTPEIFATDNAGGFWFPLQLDGRELIDTGPFDEVRFMVSIWHPSTQRTIDLDRAYVELRGAFDPGGDHWFKLAEIEPVVPAYNAGDSFDGWIVLPILGSKTAYALYGSGFEPRARLQVRASAYFVS